MSHEVDVPKIEAALADAIDEADWDKANKCADLLTKLGTLSRPLAEGSKRWVGQQATLPVKVHPTEGEADVIKSEAFHPSGDYL